MRTENTCDFILDSDLLFDEISRGECETLDFKILKTYNVTVSTESPSFSIENNWPCSKRAGDWVRTYFFLVRTFNID